MRYVDGKQLAQNYTTDQCKNLNLNSSLLMLEFEFLPTVQC